MRGSSIGSLVGAAFGLVYVMVNAGALPPPVAIPVQVLGAVAFLVVLFAIGRGGSAEYADVPGRAGFGRGYLLVVLAEVVAIAAGIAVLNGPLDMPQAGVAWVSVVVGVHFLPLASVFEVPFFCRLGAAIAVCGVAGLVLVATGAGAAPIATVSGLLPGAMLLASGWWGATRDLRRVPSRQTR